MPESQHTFPVFHPRANKVISFTCCTAEQEGPASRLEAGPYPPCSRRGRKWPGLSCGRASAWAGRLSTLLPTHSTPQLQGGIRASSTPTVPRALSRGLEPSVGVPTIYLVLLEDPSMSEQHLKFHVSHTDPLPHACPSSQSPYLQFFHHPPAA